jgi:uncharacterized Rmd1/YagE family protein
VTWGLSEAEEKDRLQLLAEVDCLQEPLLEREVDDFGYVHNANAKPTVAKDIVTLSSTDVREKLAVSFALAQSVKLGIFERTVEQTIQETRAIPERMAIDGKIRLKRTEITKRIGQLFVDRASMCAPTRRCVTLTLTLQHLVFEPHHPLAICISAHLLSLAMHAPLIPPLPSNLHSDILDHPEYFWEDDEGLPLYMRTSKYLEIERRAEVHMAHDVVHMGAHGAYVVWAVCWHAV